MIHDISPLLSPSLAVWPGDSALSREVLCDMKQGANLTLSTLRCTVHAGAHADGPNHYGTDAPSIDEQPLETYLGRAQVIHHATNGNSRVGLAALPATIDAPRVLFATGTYPDPNHFTEDFAGLEPELIDALHAHGVLLVGIDTPSVDLFSSKELPAHQRFLTHGMAILEGLVLNGVPEGVYELIALPLRLAGFDASPVRAVLRTVD